MDPTEALRTEEEAVQQCRDCICACYRQHNPDMDSDKLFVRFRGREFTLFFKAHWKHVQLPSEAGLVHKSLDSDKCKDGRTLGLVAAQMLGRFHYVDFGTGLHRELADRFVPGFWLQHVSGRRC